jgi:hypothetical protein
MRFFTADLIIRIPMAGGLCPSGEAVAEHVISWLK